MNLELYAKSKENIMDTLKGDMKDMDYITSLVKSLEVTFKDIEIHKYGTDIIVESTRDKLHIYTNGELKLPDYNQQDKTDMYIMVYNNKIYYLICNDIDLENEIIIDEEYQQYLEEYQESYFESNTEDQVLSDYEIDNYRLMEKMQEDDDNYKFMQKQDRYEGLSKLERRFSTKNYFSLYDGVTLNQYILSNYGLFKPLCYNVNYIVPLNNSSILSLNEMIDDIDIEEEYYFDEKLGLITDYFQTIDLKALYNTFEYSDLAILGEDIVFFHSVESRDKCNNLEESLVYIKDMHKRKIQKEQEYKKMIEKDEIPF